MGRRRPLRAWAVKTWVVQSTTPEGDLDVVWQAVKAMQEAMFAAGAKRLLTTLRIDDRRDKEETLERKRQAIAEKGVKVERL